MLFFRGFSCTSAKRLRPRFREHDGVVRVNVKRHCPRRRLVREGEPLDHAPEGLSSRPSPRAPCAAAFRARRSSSRARHVHVRFSSKVKPLSVLPPLSVHHALERITPIRYRDLLPCSWFPFSYNSIFAFGQRLVFDLVISLLVVWSKL